MLPWETAAMDSRLGCCTCSSCAHSSTTGGISTTAMCTWSPSVACFLFLVQLSTRSAEEFYCEHKGKAFFDGLIEFMTSGPIVAMVLAKVHAIRAWRELMGPTNVLDARLKAPRW